MDLFFHWGRETLVPNLYPGVLYNNKSDKYTGFIDDRNNYLVGISRFRQARVQKGMKKIQMKIKDKLEVMEVKRSAFDVQTHNKDQNTGNGTYVMRQNQCPRMYRRTKADLRRDYLRKT